MATAGSCTLGSLPWPAVDEPRVGKRIMAAKRKSAGKRGQQASPGESPPKPAVPDAASVENGTTDDRRNVVYRVLFVVGITFYAVMIGAGMVYAIWSDGKPPGLATDYQIAIRKYAAVKDPSDEQIEKAIHLAKLATKLDAANPHVAHSWLGWWMLVQGQREEKEGNSNAAHEKFEEAAVHYQKALAYQPNYVSATYGYSRVLTALGDFAAARQMMERTISLKEDFPRASDALDDITNKWCDSVVRDAREHYRRKETAQAIAGYQEAIGICPQQPEAYDSLAEIWATHPDARYRNGKEAVNYAKTAIDLTQGKYPFAYRTLAAAYAETGQFDQAMATANQGIQVAQSQGETGLANLYESMLNFIAHAGRCGDLRRSADERGHTLGASQSLVNYTHNRQIPKNHLKPPCFPGRT